MLNYFIYGYFVHPAALPYLRLVLPFNSHPRQSVINGYIWKMKSASINDLKKELGDLPQAQVVDLCIRLAKFKKENKELLNYLLFEAHDEEGYLKVVQHEVDEHFKELPKQTSYLTKKSLRKMLRIIAKYSKHTGSRQFEVEVRIHFCMKLSASGIHRSTPALMNIYAQQLNKVEALIQSLHEDLHYDYKKQLERIQTGISI